METEIELAGTGGRRVSTAVAVLTAVAVGIGTIVLVGLNLLAAALTCGDDGPLDYGTAGAAARRYCEISFTENSNGIDQLSSTFVTLTLLVLGAVAFALGALLITRGRGWLNGALALLGLLGAWTLALLVVV